MTIELGKFLRLGSGNGWSPEARKEWLEGVRDELKGEPFGLVMTAIEKARRHVRWPQEFVVWVLAEIRADVERLRLEESRLATLAEIADAPR